MHLNRLVKHETDSLTFVPYSLQMSAVHQYKWFPFAFHIPNNSNPQHFINSHYALFPQTAKNNKKIHSSGTKSLNFRVSIHVFAWRRSKSLSRLLHSLNNAEYPYYKNMNLIIHVDGNPSMQVLDVLKEFKWKLGKKNMMIRQSDKIMGLKNVSIL